MTKVTARVPASTANLGVGFDVLSLALAEPHLLVTLERRPEGVAEVVNTGRYGAVVTKEPSEHAGARALSLLFEKRGVRSGYRLGVQVWIPPRKGLGLSGAEAVGAVVCANRMFGLGLSKDEVVEFAGAVEPGGHLDNVAASANGGFNIATRDPFTKKPRIYTFRPPSDLGVVMIIPDVEKASTAEARKAVPASVEGDAHVEMMSRIAAISAGFASGDADMILENIAWDIVVEPARANAGVYGKGFNYHMLMEERMRLYRECWVAETISGAGPSRALWYNVQRRRHLGKAIRYVSDRLGQLGHRVEGSIRTSPSLKGAQVIRTY